jgi:DNA-binding FrmR family transcriptional regulator
MKRISMLIHPDELAAIDEVASPNRTAFMLAAVRESVDRVRRERLQAEIDACLAETADEDLSLADEFSGTAGDGL